MLITASKNAKLFAANVIGLAGVAVALSPLAAAEPAAPPAIPGVPGLNVLQQLATNPASMGAVLQTAATALNGASAIVGGGPATLPVSPIEGAPGTAPLPAAPAPVGPGATLVPLLNQLGVPANLANLTPSSMPFPIQIGDNVGIAPAPPAAPVGVAPSAPVLPLPPATGSTGQMPLLNALP